MAKSRSRSSRGSRSRSEDDTVKVEAGDMADLVSASSEDAPEDTSGGAETIPPDPPADDDPPNGDDDEDLKEAETLDEPESEPGPTEAELRLAKEKDENTKALQASRAAREAGKPVTKHHSAEPLMAVQRAFQGRQRNPVVVAFIRSEQLSHTRKLTRSEWKSEFEKFQTVKR